MNIFGDKTTSFLDVWSFEHIASGINLFPFIQKLNSPWLGLFCVSFFWEIFEHYLETGLFGQAVSSWLYGVEHWSNRMIADNLCVAVGYYAGTKYPQILNASRVFSAAWLFVHIVIFPNSMYLHQI